MDASRIRRGKRSALKTFTVSDLASFVQTYNVPAFTATLMASVPVTDVVLGASYQCSISFGGFGTCRIGIGLLGAVNLVEFNRITVAVKNASINDWCAAALYINDGTSQKISEWIGLAANGKGLIAPGAIVAIDWNISSLPDLRSVVDYGLLLHVSIGQGVGLADALEIVIGGA